MLQNLANHVQFGAKEAYMHPFNAFIDLNRTKVVQFYDAICDRAQCALAEGVGNDQQQLAAETTALSAENTNAGKNRATSHNPLAVLGDTYSLAVKRKRALDAHGVAALTELQQHIRTHFQPIVFGLLAATARSASMDCVKGGTASDSIVSAAVGTRELHKFVEQYLKHPQHMFAELQKSEGFLCENVNCRFPLPLQRAQSDSQVDLARNRKQAHSSKQSLQQQRRSSNSKSTPRTINYLIRSHYHHVRAAYILL
jgi:hypothetical protein